MYQQLDSPLRLLSPLVSQPIHRYGSGANVCAYRTIFGVMSVQFVVQIPRSPERDGSVHLQVLFNKLNMDMMTIRASQLLAGRSRDTNANPDFSNKEPSFAAPTPPLGSAPESNPLPRQLDFVPPAPAAPALRSASLPEAARQVNC